MTSITNSIHDVAGAFLASEEVLGPGRQWHAKSSQQEYFLPVLSMVLPYVPDLIKEGLLDSRVSWIAQIINDWFGEHGFSISLEQSGDPDTFYVGSIYEQKVEWFVPGEVCELTGQDGNVYRDGVRLSDGVYYHHSHQAPGPVAMLQTKMERDRAYMVMLDRPGNSPFELLTLAKSIEDDLVPCDDYEDLVFPMVHINHTVDMGWLKELWTVTSSGRKAKVTEAVQQSILKINDQGALAKSAFGMAVTLEMVAVPKPDLIIDRPFLFWISRAGYPLPLFAAWVDYSEWRNPGDLN